MPFKKKRKPARRKVGQRKKKRRIGLPSLLRGIGILFRPLHPLFWIHRAIHGKPDRPRA